MMEYTPVAVTVPHVLIIAHLVEYGVYNVSMQEFTDRIHAENAMNAVKDMTDNGKHFYFRILQK